VLAWEEIFAGVINIITELDESFLCWLGLCVFIVGVGTRTGGGVRFRFVFLDVSDLTSGGEDGNSVDFFNCQGVEKSSNNKGVFHCKVINSVKI